MYSISICHQKHRQRPICHMKNLVFSLIAFFLCAPLNGMLVPLESDYQSLLDQSHYFEVYKQYDLAQRNLSWIATHDDNLSRRAFCLYRLGHISLVNKDVKMAKFYYRWCSYQYDNLQVQAKSFLNLADIAMIQKKHKKAERYYTEAAEQNVDKTIKHQAQHYLTFGENRLNQAAKVLLSLKQGTSDESSDTADQSTHKKHKSERSRENLKRNPSYDATIHGAQRPRLTYESLLRRIACNDEKYA